MYTDLMLSARARITIVAGAGMLTVLTALHAQKPFREYPAIEYSDFPLPPDYNQPSEFVFARLMYPPAPTAQFDRSRRRGGVSTWYEGRSSWTQDYPAQTGTSWELCGA